MHELVAEVVVNNTTTEVVVNDKTTEVVVNDKATAGSLLPLESELACAGNYCNIY